MIARIALAALAFVLVAPAAAGAARDALQMGEALTPVRAPAVPPVQPRRDLAAQSDTAAEVEVAQGDRLLVKSVPSATPAAANFNALIEYEAIP